jgi:hypothetical protein
MRDVNGYALVLTFVLVIVTLSFVIFASIRAKQQTEIRKALIEKFGSTQGLVELLRTPEGQRLLADLSASGGSPLRSVLGSTQKGIVALLVGLGAVLGGTIPGYEGMMMLGAMFACAGLAFLISAAVTYRLSKSWGLIPKKD